MLRACLNFPEIILYRLYRPVLIFFSVYFPVFIRHIPAMLLIKTEKYPRKQISKQYRAKFKQALIF